MMCNEEKRISILLVRVQVDVTSLNGINAKNLLKTKKMSFSDDDFYQLDKQ